MTNAINPKQFILTVTLHMCAIHAKTQRQHHHITGNNAEDDVVWTLSVSVITS